MGARFESFKEELGWPSHESNPNCFPCLFLQFTDQIDTRSSKMLQIFSKQSPMMDALISRFHRARSRAMHQMGSTDELDGLPVESSEIDGGKHFTEQINKLMRKMQYFGIIYGINVLLKAYSCVSFLSLLKAVN